MRELADAGREFYRRGWNLGQSGNFSLLLARKPLRVCITAGGIGNGDLEQINFLELDADAEIHTGFGTPSAETLVHLTIYRLLPRARVILHTHSVWGTILADSAYEKGSLEFEGFEVLKGLAGVTTHEHREIVPIVNNSQDHIALSHVIENVIRDQPDAHGIYIRRHGLFTWGETVADAVRHVEVFEFLFEVSGRQAAHSQRG